MSIPSLSLPYVFENYSLSLFTPGSRLFAFSPTDKRIQISTRIFLSIGLGDIICTTWSFVGSMSQWTVSFSLFEIDADII